jgi:riboflavin kinase/FMN adenylyltransferase
VETARGLERLERTDRPVFVVVGVFDGLHLGHAYLLEHLVREAAARDARPMVITFDHHPDEILTGSAPPLLCDPEERLALLGAAGVEATVVVHFDQRLRETTYDAFVGQVTDRAPLAGFLMTPDAAFGYRRGGTPETLALLGAEQGFDVVVVPPFELGGHPVRSSEVRTAIGAGDIALAARLLGRPHAVVGVTETGWQGSVVAFELPVALPPDGAWDVELSSDGATTIALAHVSDGELSLPGLPPGTRVRVAFVGRAPGG